MFLPVSVLSLSPASATVVQALPMTWLVFHSSTRHCSRAKTVHDFSLWLQLYLKQAQA